MLCEPYSDSWTEKHHKTRNAEHTPSGTRKNCLPGHQTASTFQLLGEHLVLILPVFPAASRATIARYAITYS